MNSYTSFAAVYDEFMDNIPYSDWCHYIKGLLDEYHITSGTIADLGCGTGTLTRLLSDMGYDTIGVDNSLDMLEIAKDKSSEDILYLLQDMRELELMEGLDAMISICDSINYITTPSDLIEVFKGVKAYLKNQGIFIFDFNSTHYYRDELGEQVIAEDREDISFIWDNYYDEDTCINEYILSLFIKEEDNLYRKYVEEHHQRSYTLSDIIDALKASGLTYVASYDAFTRNAVHENSTRIYVIARNDFKGEKTCQITL